MKKFTLEQQIDIINNTIAKLLEQTDRTRGLCDLLGEAIYEYIDKQPGLTPLQRIFIKRQQAIPLFNRKNAILHGNSSFVEFWSGEVYWWRHPFDLRSAFSSYDLENRLLFLKWIRRQLIKRLALKQLIHKFLNKFKI